MKISLHQYDEKIMPNTDFETTQIGRSGVYIILVCTNDQGNIPHFHIVDNTTRGTIFHTCIQIEKPEYFYYTGKQDTLNSLERKQLVQFLREPDKDGVFNTNWHLLLYKWNKNNNRKIDKNLIMPHYTKL